MSTLTKKIGKKSVKKNRTQIYNAATGHYILKDTETDTFIEIKTDGKPFEGVKIEKSTYNQNPNIDKETAIKSEKAVFEYQKRQQYEKNN